ncbi:MAG: aspartate--tRNA ligase [Patescibacteria group bacterium]
MRILVKEIIDKENESIELMGWVANRRDHGKLIFIDLRDRSGLCQVVFLPSSQDYEKAKELRSEWVIKIVGKINRRPKGMENKEMGDVGNFEIQTESLEIINKAETLPIPINSIGYEIGEDIRMKYRYLDLRRSRLQKNLRMRAKIIKFIRDFLSEKEFVEIETPILGKSTPEGARDYLVPSRLHLGNFYALPQSPQQYKQLLMVAGFERYFQIARCFRDEDTRGDRQPEFTQLDIEMSFINEEDILILIEDLYLSLVKILYPHKKIRLDKNGRIPRMSYKEAMEKYNSDKPDVRDDKNNPNELAFLFVIDFPMFEWKKEEKRWDAVHHPFTKPKIKDTNEFWQEFKKDPSNILAYQYDFVLNGYEIGGGSIRIHDPELLAAVFEAMGNKKEDVYEKFGHLLEAFKYGVPPHGGIAPGIDRLMMILENEPNIREVIAFPKTGDGRDLMMTAPSSVDIQKLKELNIEIKKINE